jgi:hypothetical protein
MQSETLVVMIIFINSFLSICEGIFLIIFISIHYSRYIPNFKCVQNIFQVIWSRCEV